MYVCNHDWEKMAQMATRRKIAKVFQRVELLIGNTGRQEVTGRSQTQPLGKGISSKSMALEGHAPGTIFNDVWAMAPCLTCLPVNTRWKERILPFIPVPAHRFSFLRPAPHAFRSNTTPWHSITKRPSSTAPYVIFYQ